ncbi:hypothetical protein [Halovivax limisalsi]|nr:hypothetical protein [Halovivax limisalsi]
MIDVEDRNGEDEEPEPIDQAIEETLEFNFTSLEDVKETLQN